MADETNRPDATASSAEAASEAQGTSTAAAASASAQASAEADAAAASKDDAATVAKLTAEVEKLEGQIGDLTDRLLRAHAEMDNLRKRAEREKEETAKYAITKFAREIVNVADNFERAVQAVPAGAAEENPTLKALVEGVSMTERAFLAALEKSGVRRINPKGEPFKPAPAPGGDGGAEPGRRFRHCDGSFPGRLCHRRPLSSPRHGRRRQGRPEGEASRSSG